MPGHKWAKTGARRPIQRLWSCGQDLTFRWLAKERLEIHLHEAAGQLKHNNNHVVETAAATDHSVSTFRPSSGTVHDTSTSSCHALMDIFEKGMRERDRLSNSVKRPPPLIKLASIRNIFCNNVEPKRTSLVDERKVTKMAYRANHTLRLEPPPPPPRFHLT